MWVILKLPCFRTYLPQRLTIFHKEPHLLLKKNLNLIKYKLYGPWNDDKVNQKMRIKQKYWELFQPQMGQFT